MVRLAMRRCVVRTGAWDAARAHSATCSRMVERRFTSAAASTGSSSVNTHASSGDNSASSSLSSSSSSSSVSSSPPPLRICIVGGGISGLTLAHQLQRKFRESEMSHVEITIHESTQRTGGWVRTDHLPVGGHNYIAERGPRSFLFRHDPPAQSPLKLLSQLDLGDQVVYSDKSSSRRMIWRKDDLEDMDNQNGKLIEAPTLFKVFSFPYLKLLWEGIKQEFRTPAVLAQVGPSSSSSSSSSQTKGNTEGQQQTRPEKVVMDQTAPSSPPLPSSPPTPLPTDMSVGSWFRLRFGAFISDFLLDPMVAGVYSGNVDKLSVVSCFGRLVRMERLAQGIIRHEIWPPKELAKQRQESKRRQYEEMDAKGMEISQEPEWMVKAMQSSSYSLQGGVEQVTRALSSAITGNKAYDDPFQRIAMGNVKPPKVTVRTGTTVQRVGVRDGKAVVYTKDGDIQGEEYEHVFSTLPSFSLRGILAASPDSEIGLDQQTKQKILEIMSPFPKSEGQDPSMPFASLWLVNVAFPVDILKPQQLDAFGILVPTRHGLGHSDPLKSKDVLGIAFDSCVFPTQGEQKNQGSRVTVMMGGDRHPGMLALGEEEIKDHAIRVLNHFLKLDPENVSAHNPVLVSAIKNEHCIPQYYVGHKAKVAELQALLQPLAQLPTSIVLHQQLDQVHSWPIPTREPSVDGTVPSSLKPFTLMGTSFGGVSLNDCVHHAMETAEEFVQLCNAGRAEEQRKDALMKATQKQGRFTVS